MALAEAGKRGEVREYGKIANTPAALKASGGEAGTSMAGELRFCYEAGPCGYGIQRQLSEAGHECVVVAPVADPAQARRSDQDRPARCDQPRQAAPGG